MNLLRGGLGFDVSITVCGEDFSSTLAHKDLLEILYLRVPDDYFCLNTGLFALSYLLRARGGGGPAAPSLLHVSE